jgi:IclR family mhp operon transcriptional activator
MANVESVTRGLEILRLLNMRTGQSLSELAEGSGLPRGTAYRMLFTLENSGLVERIQNRYWITKKVRTLSHGFDDDWACKIARPVMRELGRAVHWPVTLSEQSGSFAMVRETTDSESTLVFAETKPGYRMPMLDTASGRILLAYAPQRKQQTLLDYLQCQRDGASTFSRTCSREFDTIGGVIRSRGYDSLPMPRGNQSAIAVPVVDGSGQAVAALALRYFSSAMHHSDAVDRFLSPLTASAARIGTILRQRQEGLN